MGRPRRVRHRSTAEPTRGAPCSRRLFGSSSLLLPCSPALLACTASAEPEGCTKDTDCADGRICGEASRCVDRNVKAGAPTRADAQPRKVARALAATRARATQRLPAAAWWTSARPNWRLQLSACGHAALTSLVYAFESGPSAMSVKSGPDVRKTLLRGCSAVRSRRIGSCRTAGRGSHYDRLPEGEFVRKGAPRDDAPRPAVDGAAPICTSRNPHLV